MLHVSRMHITPLQAEVQVEDLKVDAAQHKIITSRPSTKGARSVPSEARLSSDSQGGSHTEVLLSLVCHEVIVGALTLHCADHFR